LLLTYLAVLEKINKREHKFKGFLILRILLVIKLKKRY